MSAPNPNPGQPAQGHPLAKLIKPSNISQLNFIEPTARARYVSACQQCWSILEAKPKDSAEYQETLKKLQDLTNNLTEQYRRFKERQQAQGQAGSQSSTAARPASQGQQTVPAQQGPQAGIQQQQPQQSQQSQQRPAGAQQQSIPPQIIQHIQGFPWANPLDKPQGTPEGDQWLRDVKQSYLKMLLTLDSLKKDLNKYDNAIKQRNAQGQEVPPQLLQARQAAEERHRQQQTAIHNFRGTQTALAEKNKQAQAQAQVQAGGTAQPTVVKTEPGTAAPTMPSATTAGQFKMTTGGQAQAMTSTAQAQPQQGGGPVNPAMEAARNAANAGRTSMSPVNTGQQPQQPQRPQAQHPGSFPGAQPPVQGGMQQHQTATSLQRPALNSQQPAQIGQPMSSAPQSAGGPTPITGPPVPLSHAAAVTAAARSHSDQVNRSTPQAQPQPGGPYHQQQMGNREHSTNSRMPIPKFLPQAAVAPPTPVPIGAGRPTLAGPANGVGGMLGQPPIEKHTGVLVEGDGTGVLSKNKLGELVREVGGSDESLTPEVEDILLSVADEFVENVITAACRLAKLRDGADLQIRDIQTVLERNYNIRIPGYSLDETRVIRKFHPTQGWQQKMNAVQAAKVIGGKTDI